MRPRSPPHWTTSIIHLAPQYSDTTLDEETERMRQCQLQTRGVGVVNILGISGFHLTCLRGNIFPHQQSLDDSSDLVLGILSFQLMSGLVQ